MAKQWQYQLFSFQVDRRLHYCFWSHGSGLLSATKQSGRNTATVETPREAVVFLFYGDAPGAIIT